MTGVGSCSYSFESKRITEEHVAPARDSSRATDGPDDANCDLGRPGRQMHEQPATRGICCARPFATVCGFLPIHKHLAIARVGIHKDSWIGELFVRRHSGAKPNDLSALERDVFGAE